MRTLLSTCTLISAAVLHAQNPLAIPPLIEADTFQLVVAPATHEFYPGVVTNTYGINAPYLGPTLLLHKGDTARFTVHNQLPEITTMHWNGMEVPPIFDGSPPLEIPPGGTWDVKYKVIDHASIYLYHPHTMHLIGAQVGKGAAGLILVRDDDEAQLALPRTYGVDDFPIAVQDKKFSAAGQILPAALGDSILVNGTADPYLECPAQVVRLRLLNASTARYYSFGFQEGTTFHVIGGENGLLNAPDAMDRIRLASGERIEMLIDLTGMEGDSLLLMNFGTELPGTVPGSDNILWEGSSLNGIDHSILRIRVTPPTSDPITSIPNTLLNIEPYPETSATRTRVKTITGNGMVGMGIYPINGVSWDMDVINDTVIFGSTEIWTYINHSNMAHPMTMHGGTFFVLDRNGEPPAEWERGPRSVVDVGVNDTVRVIMRFANYTTDGWPLMYHCHNLMHINNMMWQFIVVDPTLELDPIDRNSRSVIHPVPATNDLYFRSEQVVEGWRVIDAAGREVLASAGAMNRHDGRIDIAKLNGGTYLLILIGREEREVHRFVREP